MPKTYRRVRCRVTPTAPQHDGVAQGVNDGPPDGGVGAGLEHQVLFVLVDAVGTHDLQQNPVLGTVLGSVQ